eukprot:scaffold15234_cov31-Tisochrysis_lutea.AAC.6
MTVQRSGKAMARTFEDRFYRRSSDAPLNDAQCRNRWSRIDSYDTLVFSSLSMRSFAWEDFHTQASPRGKTNPLGDPLGCQPPLNLKPTENADLPLRWDWTNLVYGCTLVANLVHPWRRGTSPPAPLRP